MWRRRLSHRAAVLFWAGCLPAACTAPPPRCDETDCPLDAGEEVGAPDGGTEAGPPDASEDAPVCDADTAADPANCGACENPCAPGQSCTLGVCTCGPDVDVSFAEDVQPVFSKACAGGMCHPGSSGALGLELGSGQAYGALVGRAGGAMQRRPPARLAGPALGELPDRQAHGDAAL